MSEWFESWFGREYVALYPHRDEAEAARAVALIENTVAGRQVRRTLDLACGAGRHARQLADRWWTTGLDLSDVLLQLARQADGTVPFVRADMRVLPFADESFDLVVNLFTSFGYFEDDEQHQRVLDDVGRVTSRGGTFILDFLNVEHLASSLVPYDERKVGDRVVEQRRAIVEDGRYVLKEITIRGEEKKFAERVRLYRAYELEAMLRDAGFRIAARYGDYAGGTLTDASPRMILAGVRQ